MDRGLWDRRPEAGAPACRRKSGAGLVDGPVGSRGWPASRRIADGFTTRAFPFVLVMPRSGRVSSPSPPTGSAPPTTTCAAAHAFPPIWGWIRPHWSAPWRNSTRPADCGWRARRPSWHAAARRRHSAFATPGPTAAGGTRGAESKAAWPTAPIPSSTPPAPCRRWWGAYCVPSSRPDRSPPPALPATGVEARFVGAPGTFCTACAPGAG